MTRHLTPLLAMLLLSLFSACSVAPIDSAPPLPARPVATPVLPLVQVGHGPETGFARCGATDCAQPTPKNLARTPVALREASSPARQDATVTVPAPATTAWLPPPPSSRPQPTPPQPRPSPALAAPAPTVTIYFAHGDATLAATDRVRLDEALRRHASTAELIRIAASTGGAADKPANRALARARADLVRAHLVERAPQLAPRLRFEADGACCTNAPVTAHPTALDEALRRRVVVAFEPDVRPD
jgi:outer membrane protein OmpA-like peptidoglycan-associated protein